MAEAFPRARQFLNYLPTAKWLALIGSVASGLLYVGLLINLALFVELMVDRGTVPALERLPLKEKEHFIAQLDPPNQAEWKKNAEMLGVSDPYLVGLLTSDKPEALSEKDKKRRLALLWYVTLPDRVAQVVGDDAAGEVRTRISAQPRILGIADRHPSRSR